MEDRDTYFTINTEATGNYTISVSNANSYYGSVSIKNGIETGQLRRYRHLHRQAGLPATSSSPSPSTRTTATGSPSRSPATSTTGTPSASPCPTPASSSPRPTPPTTTTISVDGGSHGSVSIEAEPAGTNSYYGIRNEYVYIDATPNTGYKVKSVTVVDNVQRQHQACYESSDRQPATTSRCPTATSP